MISFKNENIEKKDFKVLFVYPNTMMATLVPIGISLLSSCLKSNGFQVDLFDTTYYKTEEINFELKKVELLQLKPFNFEERGVTFIETNMYEDLNKKIELFKPDLIAITIVEDTYDLAISLLDSIKESDIPVIAGGVFVTFSPEEVIQNKKIDMVNVGEGEYSLLDLCYKMYNHKDYTDVENIWFKIDGNLKKNPMRKLIDLHELPFIDYDIFDKKRLYRPMQGKIYTMVHIELDRGCPYDCTYCEAPHLRKLFKDNNCGNYYRTKNIDFVIDELNYLVKKYNPDYINFNAESFLARPMKELMEFAEKYRKIGIPFWCQSRPETITEDKIRILKEMNCKNLQFGIEHGNEEFRSKILNRHYTNKKLLDGLKIVEKYDIEYTVNNIIGFPDETRDLVFDTININRKINPTTINCYLFTPYKGTTLHKYCLEKGYLDEKSKVHQLLDSVPLKMDSISYEELKGLQRTFVLYAKLPESMWDKIKIAEKFDENGNKMFEELKGICYKYYFK